jgi:hypothetical protein
MLQQMIYSTATIVLPEQLTVAQLVKKFLLFMESEGSSQRSQEPTTEPYPDPDESSTHTTTGFNFNITLPSTNRSPK